MTNRRFEELEKRAKNFQLKLWIARVLILCILALVGVFFVWYFNDDKVVNTANENSIQKVVQPTKSVNTKAESKSYKPIDTPKENKEIKPQDKTEITPQKKQSNTSKKILPYDTLFLTPSINIKEQKQNEESKDKTHKRVQKTPQLSLTQEKSEKKNLNMSVREVKSKEALLQRFSSAEDYDSAMALTKLFFAEQNFNKTIYWSKIASKLEPSKDSPWLMFAKAKEKQGDIKSAKKALELYLEYFNSNEVLNLLKSLEEAK